MKVSHFINSIDISTGGPARSVTYLIEHILKLTNSTILLFTSKSENPIIKEFSVKKGIIYFLNFNWFKKLDGKEENLAKTDVFHGHGLWQVQVHKMAKIARKHKVPYIITPRGMLEPWSLTQGALKKKIALLLFQNKDLREASCIHVTAPMELDSVRNLGFKNPVAVIPNGINIQDFPESSPQKPDKPKKILFLSRIHKKKGIEHLINAWKLLNIKAKESWIIQIVGNGDLDYIDSLNKMISLAGYSHQIKIENPVFGKEKIALFREASLFVLPTYSENFGIVIAEALASFTPVITTKGTPWEDLEIHQCGYWVETGVQPLKVALTSALQLSQGELEKMGQNGRELIEQKYSMESIAYKMNELYGWLADDKNKPDFVELCQN